MDLKGKMFVYLSLFFATLLWAQASAQYYPPKPEGLTVLESKLRPGVTISYKQVSSSLCNWYKRPWL